MLPRIIVYSLTFLLSIALSFPVLAQNKMVGVTLGGFNSFLVYGGEVPVEAGLAYKSQGFTLLAGPGYYKNCEGLQYGGALLGHFGFETLVPPDPNPFVRYGINLKGYLGWGFPNGISVGIFLAPGYDFRINKILGSQGGFAGHLNLN